MNVNDITNVIVTNSAIHRGQKREQVIKVMSKA